MPLQHFLRFLHVRQGVTRLRSNAQGTHCGGTSSPELPQSGVGLKFWVSTPGVLPLSSRATSVETEEPGTEKNTVSPLQRGRTSLRREEELGHLLALWKTAGTTKARF